MHEDLECFGGISGQEPDDQCQNDRAHSPAQRHRSRPALPTTILDITTLFLPINAHRTGSCSVEELPASNSPLEDWKGKALCSRRKGGCIRSLVVLDPSLEPNGPFVLPAWANGPGRRSCELHQGLKGRQFSMHSPNAGPLALRSFSQSPPRPLAWAGGTPGLWAERRKRGTPIRRMHPEGYLNFDWLCKVVGLSEFLGPCEWAVSHGIPDCG